MSGKLDLKAKRIYDVEMTPGEVMNAAYLMRDGDYHLFVGEHKGRPGIARVSDHWIAVLGRNITHIGRASEKIGFIDVDQIFQLGTAAARRVSDKLMEQYDIK